MAKHRDNMLEALQASVVSDSQSGATAGGGGVDPPAGSAAMGGAGRMVLPLGPGAFLVLQLVLLVLAFMAGQASSGPDTVQARVPGEESASVAGAAAMGGPLEDPVSRGQAEAKGAAAANPAQDDEVLSTRPGNAERGARRPGAGTQLTPRPTPGQESADNSASPADLAFADPANRFTLLVFTADGTDFGRQMAAVNHDNLSAQGFAAVNPRERGGKVLLHVGAFASVAAAKKARGRVAAAPGPGGRQTPYSGAYVVNITR